MTFEDAEILAIKLGIPLKKKAYKSETIQAFLDYLRFQLKYTVAIDSETCEWIVLNEKWKVIARL